MPRAAAMFFCHEVTGEARGQLSRGQKHRMLVSPTDMKPFFRLAVLFAALLASCARPAYEQRGYASYIADQYAGHHTSSGEIYYPQGWTAAHNTLPFGTQVKVKNNYNGRSVNLTVNDRFPNYPGRVINVSRAAAEYLQLPPYQLADVTQAGQLVGAHRLLARLHRGGRAPDGSNHSLGLTDDLAGAVDHVERQAIVAGDRLEQPPA